MNKIKSVLATILLVSVSMTFPSCSDDDKKKIEEITGVSFQDDRIILWEGDSKSLLVAVEPVDASTAAMLAMVEWKSSNEQVISVAGGVLTVVAPGVAEVTATLMGKSAACTVIVPMAGLTTLNRAETRIHLIGSGTATIDWADGAAPQTVTLSASGVTCERANTAGVEKQILIYGGDGVTQMNVTTLVSDLRLSSNKNLTHLRCSNTGLQTIRLGNCAALKYVDCSRNQLSFAVFEALIDALPTYPANSGTGTINISGNSVNVSNLLAKALAKGWQFEIPAVVVLPATANVPKSGQQQFTVEVGGEAISAQEVDWELFGKVVSNTNTYLNNDGLLYIAPDETSTTLTVRAALKSDPSRYGEAVVTVVTSTVTAVKVTPSPATIQKGGQPLQFSAVVEGAYNPPQDVTWTVTGNPGVVLNAGTVINAAGQLTVTMNETATTLTVRATSTLDNSKYGEATVTVQ